eukprot:4284936-Ditylum_brightwellii.AAC.1
MKFLDIDIASCSVTVKVLQIMANVAEANHTPCQNNPIVSHTVQLGTGPGIGHANNIRLASAFHGHADDETGNVNMSEDDQCICPRTDVTDDLNREA